MEAKDQFAKEDHAKIYYCYRRPTPKLLIEKIVSVLREKYQGPLDFAVDVGCGSGQSTVVLAPFFQKVHGMDVSEAMIQEAKENRLLPNVSYAVSPAEVLTFDDGSVQLINAAAAMHWFKLDEFFSDVRRVLCNNGVLAVYCYCSMKPLLDDHPALAEEVDKLWSEFYKLTSTCHAPQAKIAMTAYKDVNFPFEEVQRFNSVRDIFDGRVSDIVGYASTFSGFQNLRRKDQKKADEFLSYFEKRMKDIVTKGDLNVDETLKIYRDYCLIICRKITES